MSMTTSPPANEDEKWVLFRWDEPQSNIEYKVESDVKTFNRVDKITSKVKFPLEKIPAEVKAYIEPSETVDSEDADVIRTASEIASGEDDLVVVLHKLASWTKTNVKYDLSTLTESVSQKASWVLTNKEGVCDEIATLFIAMARSLGIPARFVSGIAYTESELFPQRWGAHGWAEVYIPDYGWIPYDVTYGQFGFVDATHIKLKESVDPKEPSSEFEWLGTNMKLNTGSIALNAGVKNVYGELKPKYDANVYVLKENIGFGSYNLIIAEIENLNDYYISVPVYVSVPKEVAMLDEQMMEVLLNPREKKKVLWELRISENLNRNYVYTFPVSLVMLGNNSYSANFGASANGIVYSFEDIDDYMNSFVKEEKKSYSRNVDFNCSIDKNEFYEDEKANIVCHVRNTGNAFLKDLSLCMMKSCRGFELGISREYNASFAVSEKQGSYDVPIYIENNDILKSSNVKFVVLDKPNIKVENIIYPREVRYDESFDVSFLLNKSSVSEPQKVNVRLNYGSEFKEWTFSHVAEDRNIVVTFKPKTLLKNKNMLKVVVSYEDYRGNKYATEKDFEIVITNISFWNRIEMFFTRIGVYINSIFVKD